MDYKLHIKKYRLLKGMTQTELARKANVKQSYISQLEKEDVEIKSPTLKTIFRIAAALQVCPYLLIEFNTECTQNCCFHCRQIF